MAPSSYSVHDHRDQPEAGTQVPAGTVEPGESCDAAAERELREESGLSLQPDRLLQVYRWYNARTGRANVRHVYLFHAPAETPDAWDHVVTGDGEDRDIVFRYRWLSLAEAERQLCGDLGASIPLLVQALATDAASR